MSRRRSLAVVTVVAIALGGCGTSSLEFPDGATAVDCDLSVQARQADAAVTLLGPADYRIGGWNHITGVGSFENVSFDLGSYYVSAKNYLPDPTCADAPTLPVVLAKKTYDWDRQHANGIEARLAPGELTFDQLNDVVIELRLRPEATRIPTVDELAAAYGDLLSPEQLAALDAGDVNLEVTVFAQGETAGSSPLSASAMLTLDPAEFADGWVRVQIPRSDLTFYAEDDYARTPADPTIGDGMGVGGLRIVPETAQGDTVRRLLNDVGFDPAAKPELFKEMGLVFALIELGRNDAGEAE